MLSDKNKNLKLMRVLTGHDSHVFRLKWSNNGKYIASPSADNTVKIWKPSSGSVFRTFLGHSHEVNCITWSPDDKFIASGADDFKVLIWDLETSQVIQSYEFHNDEVNDIAWSSDGNKVASVSDDKYIVVANPFTGDLIRKIKIHTQTIWCVSWSPSGKWIATGSDDETIRLFNLETNEQRVLRGHNSTVRSLSWLPDSTELVAGDRQGKVIIWNIDFPDIRRNLEGHSGLITSVSVSRDGKLIASKSKDDTVRLWDYDSGETISLIHEKGCDRWSCGLSFSPTQDILASLGENDTKIRIWKYNFQTQFTEAIIANEKINSIFISYSHHDTPWLEFLLEMLTPLTRRSDFKIWSDKDNETGENWKMRLEAEIEQCQCAILLVTPSFIASSFIYDIELPRLLKKDKVYWLPIRHSLYEEVGLNDIQAAWDPRKPLSAMHKDEQEFQLTKFSRELKSFLG